MENPKTLVNHQKKNFSVGFLMQWTNWILIIRYHVPRLARVEKVKTENRWRVYFHLCGVKKGKRRKFSERLRNDELLRTEVFRRLSRRPEVLSSQSAKNLLRLSITRVSSGAQCQWIVSWSIPRVHMNTYVKCSFRSKNDSLNFVHKEKENRSKTRNQPQYSF